MKGSSSAAQAAAFLVSFLAVGIPYWRIPYSQAQLPSALYRPGLVIVFLAAFACRYTPSSRFWRTLLVIGAAVPAVIAVRVAYETSADPTSHNLWPFEVVIAAFLGFITAFAGSLAGGFILPKLRP
jgi:Trk-type K+ transport system membrane component